jgi:hypothetical protein
LRRSLAFIVVPPLSRRALPTLHKEIRVSVAPLHVVGELWRDHWKKIVGAVAIPVLGWAAAQTGLEQRVALFLKRNLGMEPSGSSAPPASKK